MNSNQEKKLAGMGLTISHYLARKLAPKHLAGIFVKSEEGKGSKFFFLLENHCDDKSENSSISLESGIGMKKSTILEQPINVVTNEDKSPRFYHSNFLK